MKFFNLHKNKIIIYNKGFTLLELLVVIAIIGILSSVVMVSINNAKKKADVAYVKSSVDEIKKAMVLYYDTNGNYSSAGTAGGSRYRINDPSNISDPQSNIDPTYPGGPADCFYPFGATGSTDYSIAKITGKAMLRTDQLFQNNPMVSCALSADKQSYSIAIWGMRSSSTLLCFDSSGIIKESNIAYNLSTFSTAAFNLPPGGPVSCL